MESNMQTISRIIQWKIEIYLKISHNTSLGLITQYDNLNVTKIHVATTMQQKKRICKIINISWVSVSLDIIGD